MFHEPNNFVKIYLGVLCFVYMYSVCICAILDFVLKVIAFGFMCAQ